LARCRWGPVKASGQLVHAGAEWGKVLGHCGAGECGRARRACGPHAGEVGAGAGLGAWASSWHAGPMCMQRRGKRAGVGELRRDRVGSEREVSGGLH